MPKQKYEIREVQASRREVAGVRARVRRDRVGQEFKRYLDQVYAAGKSGAVSLDGQNIFIYRGLSGDELTVDFCVGVTAPFSAVGAVQPLHTPEGPAAMTTHIGDYSGLGEASEAVREWCRQNKGFSGTVSWEVYGHWDPDPTRLRTDVYVSLERGKAE